MRKKSILSYVICNCNATYIDVMALYLSELLNYNVISCTREINFAVRIYIFCPPFFLEVTREIRQMQPQEKRRQIL